MSKKPVVLCILDGWGYRSEEDYNGISLANTPNWDMLTKHHLHSFLEASGEAVGLPKGQMGNSEVGHMNLGAGRVVMQELPRINKYIKEGKLAQNEILKNLIQNFAGKKNSVHMLFILSDGAVHGHIDHSVAIIKYLCENGINVVAHPITDGRDVSPKSAINFAKKFLKEVKDCKNLSIATVSGRYYAMDRDNRWERVEKAYDAIVNGKGEKSKSLTDAINESYAKNVNDEFILPSIIEGYKGMKDGDALLITNYRTDRAREILRSILIDDFSGFKRSKQPKLSHKIGIVEYSEDLNPYMEALFTPQSMDNLLGEIVSNAGLAQLRAAETEKYPHVTFFFNGGREEIFKNEERILVPSPKVATYDLQPEMSAPELGKKVAEAIETRKYDFVVVNFANPDMVGHTGNLQAVVKAVETVDYWMGKVIEATCNAGGTILVTADHGNAEEMYDPKTDGPHTAHTTNPVDLYIVNQPNYIKGLNDGKLGDMAPTILELLHIDKPENMTGKSLIKR